MARQFRFTAIVIGAFTACLPGAVYAHGVGGPAPSVRVLLTRWEFDPLFIVTVCFASWLYIAGIRRVKAAHPKSPFPRRRTAFFFSGVGVLVFALISPPATYDTELFSVHMWQHLLLTMVAAPLLVLGTPITLALRAAPMRIRREVLLPALHSRVLRVLTFPVLSWLMFAAVMWGSHFSPLYNESLENAWVHRLEHFVYLFAAFMFWWQTIGVDPTAWHMPHPVRLLYVFLQMPQNSLLAVSIYSSEHVLYKHYETIQRTWGPSPLSDQQVAGVTMWVAGDLLFLVAVGFVVYGWVKQEERDAERQDRALARARAEARTAHP